MNTSQLADAAEALGLIRPNWTQVITSIKELRDSLQHAKSVAAILAHAYDHDSRPPENTLYDARGWIR